MRSFTITLLVIMLKMIAVGYNYYVDCKPDRVNQAHVCTVTVSIPFDSVYSDMLGDY